MPSVRSSIAKLFCRLNVVLTGGSYCPYKYQRYYFNTIAPYLTPKVPGVEYKSLEVSGIPAAWLIPDDVNNDQVLLYFHGGGYVIGCIKSHHKMVSRIAAAAQCSALIIDYHLAPEDSFPAAIEDALTAYRWLLSQGYDPERMIIAGDSAGGGLTVATLISLRDSSDPLPAAAILLSPWADLGVTGESVKTVGWRDPLLSARELRKWAAMYLGAIDCKDPLASPIYADLKGLPPLYIQVGSCEILLDDARRLAERAEEDGVPVELDIWEGMFHGWHALSPLVPESNAAIEKLGRFYQDNVTAEATDMIVEAKKTT
jgi:monoterpene epsilon-lactone hydrolase